MDKYLILKEKFGFTEFKYPQDSIIDNVFKGNEVIGLLPTGFGKSIIYQVLALMLDCHNTLNISYGGSNC